MTAQCIKNIWQFMWEALCCDHSATPTNKIHLSNLPTHTHSRLQRVCRFYSAWWTGPSTRSARCTVPVISFVSQLLNWPVRFTWAAATNAAQHRQCVVVGGGVGFVVCASLIEWTPRVAHGRFSDGEKKVIHSTIRRGPGCTVSGTHGLLISPNSLNLVLGGWASERWCLVLLTITDAPWHGTHWNVLIRHGFWFGLNFL